MDPLWAGSSLVTLDELPTEGRLGATDLAWFCCAFWWGRSVLSSSYLQEGQHRALQSSCQHRLHLYPITLAWSWLGIGKRSFPSFKKRTPRPSLWDTFWGSCYPLGSCRPPSCINLTFPCSFLVNPFIRCVHLNNIGMSRYLVRHWKVQHGLTGPYSPDICHLQQKNESQVNFMGNVSSVVKEPLLWLLKNQQLT